MRLIDADDLWKCETCFHMQNGQCDGYCDHGELYRPVYSKLKIVDAAPVVHGHWQFKDDFGNRNYDFVAVCSRCGNEKNASGYSHSEWRSEWRYCNACGAKLDEVSK